MTNTIPWNRHQTYHSHTIVGSYLLVYMWVMWGGGEKEGGAGGFIIIAIIYDERLQGRRNK